MSTPKSKLNKGEIEYIRKMIGGMTVDQIATALDKPAEQVQAQINLMMGSKPVATPQRKAESQYVGKAESDLEKSPMWPRIKAQFTKEELAFYKEQYGELISQFGEDVVTTEKIQVHQLITYIILGQRTLARSLNAQEECDMHRNDLNKQLSLYPNSEGRNADTRMRIEGIRGIVNELESRITSLSKEYKDLDSSQQKLMEQLKGTRDQRVQDLSKKADNYFDVLKDVLDIEKRKIMSRESKLLEKAKERVTEEFQTPMKFADGVTDFPLLNADTVLKGRITNGEKKDEDEGDSGEGDKRGDEVPS